MGVTCLVRGVTGVLQGYYRDVAKVLLQNCYIGFKGLTGMSKGYYRGVTGKLGGYFRGGKWMIQGCCRVVTYLVQGS